MNLYVKIEANVLNILISWQQICQFKREYDSFSKALKDHESLINFLNF